MVANLFRSARKGGVPQGVLRARLRQWLELQPPDHFLLIETGRRTPENCGVGDRAGREYAGRELRIGRLRKTGGGQHSQLRFRTG